MPVAALAPSSAVEIAAALAQTRLAGDAPVWRSLSRAIRAASNPASSSMARGRLGSLQRFSLATGAVGSGEPPQSQQGPPFLSAPTGPDEAARTEGGDAGPMAAEGVSRLAQDKEARAGPGPGGSEPGRERLPGRALGKAAWAFAQRRVVDGALFRFISGAVQA